MVSPNGKQDSTTGSNSNIAILSQESKREKGIIDVNKNFAIKQLKFNIQGSLLAVVESQINQIKILSAPSGEKICTLQLGQNTTQTTIIDVSFCSRTNYLSVLISRHCQLFLDLFNIDQQLQTFILKQKQNP